MNKQEKLIHKAYDNPQNLTFSEFKTLLERYGWQYKSCRGSHEKWISSTGKMLIIQNNKGKAKVYQVKQFIEMISGAG
jgi:predicted RNA binding protein YcfA (HicA-like mRNA interferase family)